jgi:phospholipid/cholesterol/gamma-HCH transport system substrate-binding protein
MRTKPRVNPVMVGLVAAVVMVAVLVEVVVSTIPGGPPMPWSHPYQIKVQLADADNLEKHSGVEIAGVKVGEVHAVEGQGDHAVVTVSLDPQYTDIHSDARALLRPHGFFGPKYLEIVPGTASAPLLHAGDVIAEKSTVLPVDLDQILHALGADQRQNLQTAVVQLGQAAAGRGDDVNHLLAAANTLTATLLDPVTALNSVAPNLSDMLVQNDAFNADFAQTPLDQLVANTNRTLAAFASNSTQLESLLTHADSTLTTLDTALSGQGGNLRAILEQAPGVIDRLNQFNGLLGAFGANLRGLQPGQPVDVTPGIIGAIENVRSAFAQSDPCTKNPGQPCSPGDNRQHYARIQVFGLLPNLPIPCSVLAVPLCTVGASTSSSPRADAAAYALGDLAGGDPLEQLLAG